MAEPKESVEDAEAKKLFEPYVAVSDNALNMILAIGWPEGYEVEPETRAAMAGIIKLVCLSVAESTRRSLGYPSGAS